MKLMEQGTVIHKKEMEKKVHDLHEENKTHKNYIKELENEIESSLDLRNHLKKQNQNLTFEYSKMGGVPNH